MRRDRSSYLIPVAGREFHKEVEPASDVFAMLQRVHEVMDRIERVRLIVLVDGTAVDPSGLEVDLDGVEVQIDVWDHQRLFRAQASGLPYEPITIDIEEWLGESLPCLEVPAETADYRAYLAIVPGTLLHRLYHEFGSRLLELNVRSFLMLRGKVNKGIRETILEQPERFMAYNNGLCITAGSLAIADRPDGGMAIRGITGMQIVNGGQTVATIHPCSAGGPRRPLPSLRSSQDHRGQRRTDRHPRSSSQPVRKFSEQGQRSRLLCEQQVSRQATAVVGDGVVSRGGHPLVLRSEHAVSIK